MQAEHAAANDRLAAVRIAVEDLNTQVSRYESEIEAVRQREDRDRSLLASGATDAKQLSDLQHELETLERRQASLEDSLLEVMERREELQSQLTAELRAIEALQADLASAQQALDAALPKSMRPANRIRRGVTRWPRHWIPMCRPSTNGSAPGEGRAPDDCWDTGAAPAGSRSTAAKWLASRRPPKTSWCAARNAARSCCGSRDSTSEGCHRSRRRIARQSRAGRLRRRGAHRRTARPCSPSPSKPSARATNNVAEYRGLIAGLEDAVSSAPPRSRSSWIPSWWWSRCPGGGKSSTPT